MTHKKLENTEQIKRLYKKILGIFDKIQHTNLRDTEININENIYGKLKSLDNLYKHLYNYSHNKKCNTENHCDCAESCIKMYKKYIEECNRYYYTPFCRELQKFGVKFNDTIKKINRCKDTVKLLPIFSKYNFDIVILIPIVALLFACSLLFILYKVN
ncbi:hypothetical protein PVNG_05860 [Plasmodium vivax North Korean]|uniref:Variable surface protein n=1 Tax=Plasmodium vivax North Korean TaxID=1035514 RepID=A0A0J9W6Z3_PLAVI|nr:hypothetical protein PVNG_05860 [Plasmodium vivax North Korean]